VQAASMQHITNIFFTLPVMVNDHYHMYSDNNFILFTVHCLINIFTNDGQIKEYSLPARCKVFQEKYDLLQEQIKKVALLDELIVGMSI